MNFLNCKKRWSHTFPPNNKFWCVIVFKAFFQGPISGIFQFFYPLSNRTFLKKITHLHLHQPGFSNQPFLLPYPPRIPLPSASAVHSAVPSIWATQAKPAASPCYPPRRWVLPWRKNWVSLAVRLSGVCCASRSSGTAAVTCYPQRRKLSAAACAAWCPRNTGGRRCWPIWQGSGRPCRRILTWWNAN